MKNKTTVALLVLGIGLVSCKKVYNYPESKKNELTVNNTITDKSLVSDNSVWTLVEVAPFSDPNNRYFKFESNGKYVVNAKDIATYYWKTDIYFVGSLHSGTFVKSLM